LIELLSELWTQPWLPIGGAFLSGVLVGIVLVIAWGVSMERKQ